MSDITRAFSAKTFILAAVAAGLALIGGSVEAFQTIANGYAAPGFHAQTLISAMSSDIFTMALPFICTLPYAGVFIDERKSGYYKAFLMRTTKAAYVRGKVVAAGLSGAGCVLAAVMVVYLLYALVFTPIELAQEGLPPMFPVVFGQALRVSLVAALFALIGGALATLTLSKYMAYASPFVIFYVLVMLYERYFRSAFVISPKEWMNPANEWVMGDFGVVVLLLELIAVAALLFGLAVDKKLNT